MLTGLPGCRDKCRACRSQEILWGLEKEPNAKPFFYIYITGDDRFVIESSSHQTIDFKLNMPILVVKREWTKSYTIAAQIQWNELAMLSQAPPRLRDWRSTNLFWVVRPRIGAPSLAVSLGDNHVYHTPIIPRCQFVGQYSRIAERT